MRRRLAPTLDSPAWRYALIFGIYGYQGVVAGGSLTALPAHYAAEGFGGGEVGRHLALAGLPWALQPLWGPVVDGLGDAAMGRRRAWVLAGLAASLAALALLLVVGEPRGSLAAVTAVFTLHSAAAALVDTATDAMVIDRVPADRLGAATACTRAGFVTGTLLGAWAVPPVLAAGGIAAAGALLLALGVAALALPMLVRERPDDAWLSLRARPRAGARPAAGVGRALLRLLAALRRRQALALIAFCVAEEVTTGAAGVRLGLDLVQAQGWGAAQVSRLQGSVTFVAGTLGVFLVGRWVDRVEGPHRALALLLGACAAGHVGAGLLLAAAPGGWSTAAALVLSGLLPALVFAALAPAVMRASRGAAAASRFALFMAALNLGGVAGAGLGGAAAEAGVATWQIVLAAGAALGGLTLVARHPRLLFRDAPRAP